MHHLCRWIVGIYLTVISPCISAQCNATWTYSVNYTCSIPNKMHISLQADSIHAGAYTEWFYNSTFVGSGWDLGYIFPHQGADTILAVLVDTNGCSYNITIPVNIAAKSNAQFYVLSNTTSCPPFPVQFYAVDTDHTVSNLWYFGDGDTSSQFSPLHVFYGPGDYYVKRITTGAINTCPDIFDSIPIHVGGPTATFSTDPDSGCAPLAVNFSINTHNTSSLLLDYGDGAVYTSIPTLPHVYYSSGLYIPTLTLHDALGCTVGYQIDSIHVLPCQSTGIEENSESSWHIYPNPAVSLLYFSPGPLVSNPGCLHITDVMGRNFPINCSFIQGEFVLDLSALQPGFYYLDLKEGDTRFTRPFVKQ